MNHIGMNDKAAHTDGYVLAAATVDSFDPDDIEPVELAGSSDLGTLLSNAIVTQTGSVQFEWRLPDELRRRAIQFMGVDRLRRAIERRPVPADAKSVYQRVFEHYVRGDPVDVRKQSLEELQASLQSVRLLSGVVDKLPEERELTAIVERERYLEQFRQMAGEHFVGREPELARLRLYVDALPTTGLRSIARSARVFAGAALGLNSAVAAPPLLIQGTGGIGKSAFIAKFLLDHATLAPGNLVCAYIDFDRSAIWPEEPLTVLADMAAQMANQVADHAAELRAFQRRILEEVAKGQDHSAGYDSLEALGNSSVSKRRMQRHVEGFGELAERLLGSRRRVTLLLILDTFEEVTQRTDSHLQTFWEFVGELQNLMPRLRVVISGRTNLPKFIPHQRLTLEPLDQASAAQLLERHGLPARHAQYIAQRIEGRPLTLRLAIQLLQSIAGEAGVPLEQIEPQALFDGGWDHHCAEGLLYRRIISHIDDPVVRKVANPGFALRELTPNLILHVLRQPCELEISSIDEARQVFSQLAIYNSLVSQYGESVLRQRRDVRKIILGALRATQEPMCIDIWTRAIAFYAERKGTRNRAEELYYRLMCNQRADQIVPRWVAGVEKSLMGYRDEYPRAARDLLDQIVTLSASGKWNPNALSAADVPVLYLAEEMKIQLERGRPAAALELYDQHLQSHPDASAEPPGPVFPLLARAYAQLSKVDLALRAAREGMDALAESDQCGGESYSDLLLLACQIKLSETSASRFFSFPGGGTASASLITVEEIWNRYSLASLLSPQIYQLFRIVVYLLELADTEAGEQSGDGQRDFSEVTVDTRPAPASRLFGLCANEAKRLLKAVSIEKEDVDGMLLLRAFAWLATYFPNDMRTRELLFVPRAFSIFVSEFAAPMAGGAAGAALPAPPRLLGLVLEHGGSEGAATTLSERSDIRVRDWRALAIGLKGQLRAGAAQRRSAATA